MRCSLALSPTDSPAGGVGRSAEYAVDAVAAAGRPIVVLGRESPSVLQTSGDLGGEITLGFLFVGVIVSMLLIGELWDLMDDRRTRRRSVESTVGPNDDREDDTVPSQRTSERASRHTADPLSADSLDDRPPGELRTGELVEELRAIGSLGDPERREYERAGYDLEARERDLETAAAGRLARLRRVRRSIE